MLIFGLRRLLYSLPVLLVASFLFFVAVRAVFDPLTKLRQLRDPEAVARETERLGLDQPVAVQYWRWLSSFVAGDWGVSTRTSGDVRPMIGDALAVTGVLLLWGLLFATLVAVGVGVYSAVRQYSAGDHVLTGLSYVGLAMPAFWFGLILIQALAVWPQEVFGWSEPALLFVGLRSAGEDPSLADSVRHLVLPVLTLTVGLVAAWSRFTRAAMLDALSSDYVRTARAKGVSRRRVVVRHALRNSWGPLMTVVALDAGLLVGGLVITEQVFSIPGMGRLFLDSLVVGDVNVLLPWMLVVGLAVIGFNLIADIGYGLLDPRVRVS